MKYFVNLFLFSFLITIVGCGGGSSSETVGSGTPNPYQGTYVGTETLEGGSTVAAGDFPLTIVISANGEIRITDVDGISANGQLEENTFLVVRASPRQVFEGTIENNAISGVTTENSFTGDGTFALTLME